MVEVGVKVTRHNDAPLPSHSRCDRCAALAYVEVLFPSGTLLAFCAHHADVHLAKLLTDVDGLTVADHRPYLATLEKEARPSI